MAVGALGVAVGLTHLDGVDSCASALSERAGSGGAVGRSLRSMRHLSALTARLEPARTLVDLAGVCALVVGAYVWACWGETVFEEVSPFVVRFPPWQIGAITDLPNALSRASLYWPQSFALQHLVSLGIHLANVGLLWVFLWRAACRWPVCCLAASLFALHPLGSEAVVYLAARGSLLATTGLLIGAIGLVSPSRVGEVIAVVGLGIAGLSHSATAASAIVLFPLVAWWARRRVWLIVDVVFVLGVFFWIPPTEGDAVMGSAGAFLLRQVGHAGWLLVMAMAPLNLSLELPTVSAGVSVAVAGMLLIASWGLWLARHDVDGRARLFGWFWGFGALLPRLVVPRFEGLHERHAYLALVGWMLLAALLLESVIAPRGELEKGVMAHG